MTAPGGHELSEVRAGIIGLISDTHGNDAAVAAVMAELTSMGVDDILAGGDMVGYNVAASEVIDLLEGAGVVSVAGNHDRMMAGTAGGSASPLATRTLEITRPTLSRDQIRLLAALPPHLHDDWPSGRVLMVHGTPDDPLWGYLHRGDVEAVRLPDDIGFLICGATHRPLLARRGSATIINPGSVGLPRDGDPRPSFATIDPVYGRVRHHRVLYDPSRLAIRNSEAGIPATVNDYLFLGQGSPVHVSLDYRRHASLDEAASALMRNGTRVTRTAAGMFVEMAATSPDLIIVAVLDDDINRLLIRTAPIPEGVARERDRVGPATVVAGNRIRWLEVASTVSVDRLAPEQITSWCEEIEEAIVDLLAGGRR